MMGLLLGYTLRNLAVRKLTTALTVFGLGLVVFVFAAVMMLAHGLEETLVETGSPDNVIAIRAASNTETVSIIVRDQKEIIATQPEVAVAGDGKPIAAGEIVILMGINKRKDDSPANVVIRGTVPEAFTLRPNVKITAGRMFTPGTSEVIAGKAVAANFQGCGLGEHVNFAGRDWDVVGVFDAGGAGFDSELWGDVDQVQQSFRRPIFSSVTVKLRDPAEFKQLKERLESDPRLTLDVKRELDYYADQSRFTASFIRIVGSVISVIFAFGAIVGAMITMYAAVANRTAEIGTLRALGFSRWTVLMVFLVESIWLSLLGGGIGLIGAALMSFVRVSTMNWDTFSELAFSFALSPRIIIGALIFALAMGLCGGFLPAVRAARARIVESLRAA